MGQLQRAWTRLRGWSWPKRYPVAYFPNPPLIVGLVALGLRYVTTGALADAFSAIGYVFIAIWAYLELTDGENLFRRLLGAAGLVYAITMIAQRMIQ